MTMEMYARSDDFKDVMWLVGGGFERRLFIGRHRDRGELRVVNAPGGRNCTTYVDDTVTHVSRYPPPPLFFYM